jgi:hypothetical protein
MQIVNPTFNIPSAEAVSVGEQTSGVTGFAKFRRACENRWQSLLDTLSPQTPLRWGILVFVVIVYILRVYYTEGFHIVTYGLGIFMLNLLIGFLTPLDETQFEHDDDGTGDILPTEAKDDTEYKPFVRRLPEFKFWYACVKAIFVAIMMTFFPIFDIPVFWPILLIYFFVLFALTMKKQLLHAWKHNYNPCNPCGWGKKNYKQEQRRIM